MVSLPSEFRPSLESYQGPLDLLLFLIRKDEIDVFDIPIARIIEQYQIYLEVLSQLDPNSCGEFLVMAAHLMEIKSKLLLPKEELPEEGDLEDPRIELVRQLLEYKKFKERALLLEKRIDERRRRHERPRLDFGSEEIVSTEGAIRLGNVSIWDLFTAFHKIQLALGAREPHRVVLQERPIEEYISDVEAFLSRSEGQRADFEDLFAEARNRYEAIGYLLAILEMAKERRLSFHQEATFGRIEVRLHDEAEVRRLLSRANEEVELAASAAAALAREGASGASDQAAAQEGAPAVPTPVSEPAAIHLLRGEGHEAAAEPILGEDDPASDSDPMTLP